MKIKSIYLFSNKPNSSDYVEQAERDREKARKSLASSCSFGFFVIFGFFVRAMCFVVSKNKIGCGK